MKNLRKWFYLILFLSISCNRAKSQVFSGLAFGYDTKGSPIGNLSIGYNYEILNLQGEIRPSLTRKVEMNNLLGLRLSLNLINPDEDGLSILPGVGYYYNHESSDKRNLNKWQLGYSIKSSIVVTDDGSLFIEGFYSNSFQITIGMQVTLHKKDHY